MHTGTLTHVSQENESHPFVDLMLLHVCAICSIAIRRHFFQAVCEFQHFDESFPCTLVLWYGVCCRAIVAGCLQPHSYIIRHSNTLIIETRKLNAKREQMNQPDSRHTTAHAHILVYTHHYHSYVPISYANLCLHRPH